MKVAVFTALSVLIAGAAPAQSGQYKLARTVRLGAPDQWDYVVYDQHIDRVFVAHGNRVDVVDASSGTLVGAVEGIQGEPHGTAVSLRTNQGITDDGDNGQAIIFDLQTLKVKHEIPVQKDADAIALDPVTGHVFVAGGDPGVITIIDAKTNAQIGRIQAHERLEYTVADGTGSVYAVGEGRGDLLKIDARQSKVLARWPAAGCMNPHGLAVDARSHRAFMGCVNKIMVVLDTLSGRLIAKLPIGRGSDAIAFDTVRKRTFSSNGKDGTITAYQQVSPNRYAALPTIRTGLSARTMSVDSKTGRLFVAGADAKPSSTPGGRPNVTPGTLRLMIFEPK